MFCRQCGKEVSEGAVFCNNCGARVKTEAVVAAEAAPEEKVENKTESAKEAEGVKEPQVEGAKKAKKEKKKGKGGIIALVILAILLVGGGVGAGLYFTSDSYNCKKNLKLAEESCDEGEYEDALEYYEAALELDPSMVDIYEKCADLYVENDDYEEAVKLLENGIKENKEEEDAENTLTDKLIEVYSKNIEYYIADSNFAQAFAVLDEAAAKTEADAFTAKRVELYSAEADFYLNNGDYAQALTAVNEGIAATNDASLVQKQMEIYSQQVAMYSQQADNYWNVGDYEQALAVLGQAISVTGDASLVEKQVEIYKQEAESYANAGDYEQAIEVLDEAISVTGDASLVEKQVEIYKQEAESYANAGDYEQALEVLDEAISVTGDESLIRQREQLYNEKEPSEALDAAGRIEFESCFEGQGLATEASCDEDGTDQLAGLYQSGYAAYNVNLGDGGYEQAAIRYSSATEGGKVEIHYMSADGDLIGEVDLPGTGDWATYNTVTVDLPELASFAREKALYFVFSGTDYLFNLNWFRFYQVPDAAAILEAENFVASNAVSTEGTSDSVKSSDDDQNIGGIQAGAWTMYKVDLGEGGFKELTVRASSADLGFGSVEVRLGAVDGQLLGTVHIPSTGDWSTYQDFTAELPDLAAVTGNQDIYMVYVGDGYLFNINNFRFSKGAYDASARVEAEYGFEYLNGVAAEDCSAETELVDGPTQNIGGVVPGTAVGYYLDFGDGGFTKMKVRASSPQEGGDIIVHKGSPDGEEVFRVTIGDYTRYGIDWANYGDWEFENVAGLDTLIGKQILYFEFQTPEGSSASHCFNINWYEFTK